VAERAGGFSWTAAKCLRSQGIAWRTCRVPLVKEDLLVPLHPFPTTVWIMPRW
jgi:hypothetical protein